MNEQQVIEKLCNYKRLQARMQILSNYSVGAGITVSRLNEDDQLQELHRKLRGLPSYMYLSEGEQRLENVAHTYLQGYYPSGIQSQKRSIRVNEGLDDEDKQLLKVLKTKIAKVMAARGYHERDDIDQVLDRLAEYQDLQNEIRRIDDVLKALEVYKPEYARLLRLRYIDDIPVQEAAARIGIAERTFRSWRTKAINEFIRLAA